MPTIDIASHRIDLRVVTGKVVGLRKQYDTHVFGGGGRGSISTDLAGNVRGTISTGSTSSSIVYRQEFFISRDGQPDIHNQLTASDSRVEITVNDGHTVTRIETFCAAA